MIELTTPAGDDTQQEMVDLFSIDGKVYQIPAKPRANIGLKYLMDLREHGPVLAEMNLTERLIGDEGYRALSEWEHLTPQHLAAIQAEVQRVALGSLEADQGNGSGGPDS